MRCANDCIRGQISLNHGALACAYSLDAPCSATGVVRRQPDILLHRRPEDLEAAKAAFYEPTGTEVFTTSPEELARFQAAESQKWGRIVKAAGIEAE